MDLYLIIMFCSIALLLNNNNKPFQYCGNILLCMMALMCMVRSENVGIDTYNYQNIFESGYRLRYYLIKDPLFAYLGLLVGKMNGDYRHFQVLMTSITYIPLFYIFNKKGGNIIISLFIFIFATNRYFFETFTCVRQLAATPYLLLCWIFLEEKKFIKAAIFFLIALGLHHTSFIYLPIALIAYFIRIPYVYVVISVVMTFIFSLVISDMNLLVNIQEDLFGDDFVGKYDTFAKNLARTVWGLLPVILPYSIITILYYDKLKDLFIFRLYSYGVILMNFVSVLPMSYRISLGVIALELIIYPILLKSKDDKRIFIIIMLICLSLYSFYDFITTCERAHLVPYTMFRY